MIRRLLRCVCLLQPTRHRILEHLLFPFTIILPPPFPPGGSIYLFLTTTLQAFSDVCNAPLPYFCDFAAPAKLSDAAETRRNFPPGKKVWVQPPTDDSPPLEGSVSGTARGRVAVSVPGAAEPVAYPAGMVMDPELLQLTMDAREAEKEAVETRRLLQAGAFQCMTEEILATMIFDVVREAAMDPSNPVRLPCHTLPHTRCHSPTHSLSSHVPQEHSLVPVRGSHREKLAQHLAASK